MKSSNPLKKHLMHVILILILFSLAVTFGFTLSHNKQLEHAWQLSRPASTLLAVLLLAGIAGCASALGLYFFHRNNWIDTTLSQTKPASRVEWILVLYGLALALYFVARYDGQWIETDTNSITRMVTAMQTEGTLVPQADSYQHGFLYTSVSTFFSDMSGFPVGDLQRLVYPFIGILALVGTALVFYRQVTGNSLQAAFSVLLLCFQPDVLFVILRGSHEKLDWPLMMAALVLLYLGIGQPARKLLAYLLLFYMVVFAQVTTNVYFASTFLAAVALSLLIGYILCKLLNNRSMDPILSINRLLYTTLSTSILLYLFIVYLYPPAQANILLVGHIIDRVSALLLSFEPASQPYQYISYGWINSRVYLGLTIFTWILIACSFAEWCYRFSLILTRRETFNLRNSLDWLLYAGFALQVGLSIAVDYSGVLSSNLQLRVFPGFSIMACLLLAKGLWRVAAAWTRNVIARSFSGLLLASLCAWFAVAALFKSTNEPLLSNKWSFYSQGELAAIDYAVSRLQNTEIWLGVDERLWEAYMITHGNNIPGNNSLLTARYDERYRYTFISTREKFRAERTGFNFPALPGWLCIYDDGDMKLYHLPGLASP